MNPRFTEQQRRRELFPETSGYVTAPPVIINGEGYTPTLRRIDWCEVALIGFGAVVVFVAAFLIGYARAKGSGV